jgi:hypothetical protein
LYSIKEHSCENILFYETVQYYKKSGLKVRIAIAEEIIKTFFDESSNVTINTTNSLKSKVQKQFKDDLLVKGECEETLFDEIVKDLVSTTLRDVYMRFERSILYKQMMDSLSQTSVNPTSLSAIFNSIPESDLHQESEFKMDKSDLFGQSGPYANVSNKF